MKTFRYPILSIFLLGVFSLASCKKDKTGDQSIKSALAFLIQNNDSTAHLWYVATDGSSYTQILPENVRDGMSNPAWSSDGRSVFYIKITGKPGENGVYTVKPNGSDFKKVYTDNSTQIRNYYQLAASGDNEHVIFSLEIPRSNRKVIELYRMCPCGERVERLTSFETSQTPLISTESYAGSFGPGDTTLVFCQSDPTKSGIKNVNIYSLNMKTKETVLIRTVKATSAAASTPDFSPDGKQMLLSVEGLIYSMNADGSNLKTVGNLKGFRPSWDKNGKDFYFSSYDIGSVQPGIFRSNITFTDVQKITRGGSGQFGGHSVNK